MRIGLDVTKAVMPRDGVGTYAAELAGALMTASRDETDLELVLYSLDAALDPRTLRRSFPEWPEHLHVSAAAPADDGLDLFHVTGWAVPPSYGGPLVYTCYDLTFLDFPAHHTLDNKVHCLTGVLQAQLAGATLVAISKATARDLATWLGMSPPQVRVIYPAAAPVFRPLPEEEARRHLAESFHVGGDFALAVGTLEPRKNLARLVTAYRGLPVDLQRRCPLLVAGGKGWNLDEDELFRADTVRPLGFVEREDLVALYSAAAVFAYPSLAEGFGLPVAEAMACGAPVVTSTVSSLPEVAGAAAVLVDPLDVAALGKALQDLIEKPAERKRRRRLSLERAAAFSWHATARQTLDLYREILQTV